MENQIWLITAATGGFGESLAKYALSRGDKVVATSRTMKKLNEKFGGESENFLPFELKFEGDLQVKFKALVEATQKKFDNLVNNAGYGLLGIVEETSEADLRT